MKGAAMGLAFLAALSGCVSSGKYKLKENELADSRRQCNDLRKEMDASKAACADSLAASQRSYQGMKNEAGDYSSRLQSTTEQLASASVQLASVQKSNKDLQETLQAKQGELSKKVSDLIKEKDALNQKLADAKADHSALRKAKEDEERSLSTRLEAALAEKKALEEAKERELNAVKNNYEALTASLKSEISAGEIKITQLKGKLTVNMVDRILFDSGEAEVKPAGRKILDRLGGVLVNVADKDIRIEGHTDNVPIGGELKNRFPTNWELSTARATAVARFLQDTAKIPPIRLLAAGFGEYRPVAPNDRSESRALNRRIEIVLVPRDAQ